LKFEKVKELCMEHIAIVTSGILPVPAVKGGAVEVLLTYIIEQNEIKPEFYIDVYTIADENLCGVSYKYTNIIQIKFPIILKLTDKIFDKLVRTFKINGSYRSIDDLFSRQIRGKKYKYIIIENMMTLFKKIYQEEHNDNLFFHMHNDIDRYRPDYLCKYIAQNAKAVISVSQYIKYHFTEEAPGANIQVLYNCVDCQLFNYHLNEDKDKWQKKYGVNGNNVVFLFSGRLIQEKGIFELLEAFRKLHQKVKNTQLLIAGTFNMVSDKKNKYQKLISNRIAEMEDSVAFSGPISRWQMPEVYAASDAVVIPSLWEEPFGVVALEAMAMKKPIISTDSGGLPEILNEDNTILIDKKKDVTDNLYAAMLRLYEDNNLREKMGENSLNRLNNNKDFHVENYLENFTKIIKYS